MAIRSTHWIAAIVVGTLYIPALADCGACPAHSEARVTHGCSHAKESTCGGMTAEVGSTAPDFALKDLNGKTYKLSDLRGHVVVLEWVNHECPFTNRVAKNGTIRRTMEKFAGKPVVWLGIDSSHFSEVKRDKIRRWSEDNQVDYPILLDAPGEVGKAYNAKTTPHVFVIDQNGKLAYQGALDNDPYGNKENDRNYVEEAVSALLNGSTVAAASNKSYGCSVKYATN